MIASLATAIAQLLKVTLEVAQVIIKKIGEGAKTSDPSEDSQVLAYARSLLNELQQNGLNAPAVALLRSGLNYEIKGENNFLDTVIINGRGYDTYVINQGVIINNGERGFVNWTVVGNSRQDNNVIYVPA